MTKRNKKHPQTNRTQTTGEAVLRACGIGTALGIALLLLMAVVLSFAVLKSASPSDVIRPAAMICVFACGYGGALAGAKSASASDCNPHVGGLCVFGALALLLSVVSLFFANGEDTGVLQRLLPLGVLAVACALGSLTAVLHRPSQKKQLKKLMRR